MSAAPAPPARGERTRTLILQTALRLFRERGYEKTTMRAIAAEAGVSVGNAYYYFQSKEHLVQAFYARLHIEHEAAARPLLVQEREFAARLRGVAHAWVDVAAPYHEFAGSFFKVAAEPSSPLSPFSPQSRPAREASVALFREVLDGSAVRLDRQLRAELPDLLWLAHMGLVLFWVHDRSPTTTRTRALVDRMVPLLDRLVGLSRLRALRPVTREVVALLREPF